jgi:hypothetical protein
MNQCTPVFILFILVTPVSLDDPLDLSSDLFLLVSGENIHIVSSLTMLEPTIIMSGTRSNKIRRLNDNDPLTV